MSRITERLNVRGTKPYKVLTETFNGPASYVLGGSVYNSTILRQLERATALNVTGGFIGEVVTGSVSGNAFQLKLYVTSGGNAGGGEVSSGTSMLSRAITVLIEGF